MSSNYEKKSKKFMCVENSEDSRNSRMLRNPKNSQNSQHYPKSRYSEIPNHSRVPRLCLKDHGIIRVNGHSRFRTNLGRR